MPAGEDRSYSGNAVPTTLSASISNITTAIPIAASTGWPDGTGGPFFVYVDSEVIKCTSRTGLTLNVQTTPVTGRGWDGTTAASHLTGAVIQHVFTATDAEDANEHISDTSLDHHTQYLTVARHDVSARHGFGILPTAGTPSTSVVGDTAISGSSNNVARVDHKHAREGFGTPVTTKNANANGSATTVARSDHIHRSTPIVCTSTTRPTGADVYVGLTIIETDTRKVLYSDGGNWLRIGWTGVIGRTGASLHRTSYDIPSGGGSPTILPWSSETFDSDGFIAPDGTTTTTFSITDSTLVGLYIVTVVGTWPLNFPQRSHVEIIHAGSPATRYRFSTVGEDRWAATAMLTMDPGDPAGIQVGVYQESGSTQQVTATAEIYRLGL